MIIEQVDHFRNGTRIIDKERSKWNKSIYYLKQCPRCGRSRLCFHYRSNCPPRVAIICPRCGITTNYFATEELTLDAPLYGDGIW